MFTLFIFKPFYRRPIKVNKKGPKRGGSVKRKPRPYPRTRPMVDALKTDFARKVVKTGIGFLRSRIRKRGQVVSQFIPPSVSGGITSSFYRVPNRKMSSWLRNEVKAATLQNFTKYVTAFITSQSTVDKKKLSTGQQAVFEFRTPSYHEFKYQLFNTILNGTAAETIAPADYNKKVFIRNMYRKDILTNFDYSTVMIDIYIFTPRNRAVQSALDIWEAYSAKTTATIGTDYDAESNFGDFTAALRVPYASPFNCRSLTESYRCVHSKRVELQGGNSHSFTLSIPLRRVFTGYSLYGNTGSAQYVMGIDYITLYVVNGTPVYIPNPDLEEFKSQIVTTSKIAVGLLSTVGGTGCVIGTTTKQNILTNAYQVVTTAELVPTDLTKPTD